MNVIPAYSNQSLVSPCTDLNVTEHDLSAGVIHPTGFAYCAENSSQWDQYDADVMTSV